MTPAAQTARRQTTGQATALLWEVPMTIKRTMATQAARNQADQAVQRQAAVRAVAQAVQTNACANATPHKSYIF